MDITKFTPDQQHRLIENRWASSDTVWEIVKKSYEQNTKVYRNTPDWVDQSSATRKRSKIRANRIFRDVESVINALIANLPKPNFVPTRNTPESKALAQKNEKFFIKKYDDRNVKETMRKGFRNLYFGRLIVLKPFWNAKLNDFDVRALDPRKVRISKGATKEDDSEFAIEEVEDNLIAVYERFPEKGDEILKEFGYSKDTLADAYINNPTVVYKEAWVNSEIVICKLNTIILSVTRNPYWDWDGLMVTRDEYKQLKDLGGQQKKDMLLNIRMEQKNRVTTQVQADETTEGAVGPEIPAEMQQTPQDLQAYYFNHFDHPRKPYIIATIFNNENTPVGQTDMITQAMPLQEGIDRRKQDIDENASLVNGQIKVDSSVMSKADAQKLRYEARGVIWGKGVKDGVTRETGQALPQFVYEDMVDSRNEIDNIMGASAAFRGEREGQETKAGRLALIDQSYMALNELVQVGDYCAQELFNWFYQLAKVRYTEHHYAKDMGKDGALEEISLMQDDFEDGSEVRVIKGKMLPEDRQFKFEQAQKDLEGGYLSPVDYFDVAGYDDPMGKAKNAVKYKLNPPLAVGLTPEEVKMMAPPQAPDMPSRSISFKDLPLDGQIQLAKQANIVLNPAILIGEKMQEQKAQKEKDALEARRTDADITKKMTPAPVKGKA